MGLPIYQIEAYQKTAPKVKHTSITQKSPIWSSQLENIESLQKNPTKSKKNSKTFEQTLQYWQMGLPIYQIEAYQKTAPKVKHTSITQKSPIWSSQLENIESLQKNPTKSKKNIKTFEQTLQYLKIGLPICQTKAYQKASP